MKLSRRRLLSAGSAAAAAGIALPRFAFAQGNAIKLGTICDTSGPLQPFGTQKLQCIQLAVEEINAAGGLLGRKIELVSYDGQSNDQFYAQYAQQIALKDRVAVVHAGLQSSSREVIRPIFRRAKTLYFYNTPYEGGVCDRNAFLTGTTPGQLLANLLPFMIKKFGKKIYVLAADYNFGQLSEKWTRKIAKENGAEVVASEFFPLDVNQFGPTIGKIQAAKPNFIVNTFVGPAHAAFYGQWAGTGMKKEIPIASQTFGEAGEHLRMPPELSEGIYVCYNYFEELDRPANKAFLERFRKKFGDKYGYISDLGMSEYMGVNIWAAAVKKAGSIAAEAVTKALESGLSLEGPGGTMTADPKTHHFVFDMHLAEVKSRKFEILQSFKQVPPTNPDGVCDLIKNPDTNKQFEPKL
ncbi:MAG: transporter substrate-binding protein [Rhodospirillaceae bacterium]|nr:transporter substrate-binding protein [Rhodospirillaceae bacterium]